MGPLPPCIPRLVCLAYLGDPPTPNSFLPTLRNVLVAPLVVNLLTFIFSDFIYIFLTVGITKYKPIMFIKRGSLLRSYTLRGIYFA